MKLYKTWLVILACVFSGVVFADVPIVDLSESAASAAATTDSATTAVAKNSDSKQSVAVTSDAESTSDVSTTSSSSNDVAAPASVTKIPPLQVTGTVEQRVARLERQVQVLLNTNNEQGLENLQQQGQKLNGQVETNAHNIKMLQDQVQAFYQDLEQRLNKLQTSSAAKSSDSSSVTTNSKDFAAQQSTPKEKKAYDAAFNLLRNKKYSAASKKFLAYVKSYPKGTFAVNSHYWIGEIAYLSSDFSNAYKEFQIVVKRYPHSIKVPDAMLKIAIIDSSNGKTAQAKAGFLAVKKKFPTSDAAKLADQQLKLLKK